jgi:hypothetical protein
MITPIFVPLSAIFLRVNYSGLYFLGCPFFIQLDLTYQDDIPINDDSAIKLYATK